MKKKTWWFLLVCVLLYGAAEAGEIVAVQSQRLQPYDQALNGFKAICNRHITRFVISEMPGGDIVEKIYTEDPALVVAIGNEALATVKEITTIPIVYVMVHNPRAILSGQPNITGVSMNIPVQEQLSKITLALPDVKRIGIIYDPLRTGGLVDKIKEAARLYGVTVVARAVSSSPQVPSELLDMKGEIDSYWMLPDLTVVNRMNVEFLFVYSLENSLPVIAFSDKYVATGATLSIGIDAFDIGSQAGGIAENILAPGALRYARRSGPRKAVVSYGSQIARKAVVTVNQTVAKNLGLTVYKEIPDEAGLVD